MLGLTLDAVQYGTCTPDEIIVVDGKSTDQTVKIAQAKKARVIENSKVHVAAGRQIGAECALGSIIVYTDSDCIPAVDWLEKISAYYDNDPELVGVGGRVVLSEPRTNIQKFSAGVFETIMNFPDQPMYLTNIGMHGVFPGANCSFRKKYVLEAGGFRDFFSNHAEEVDLVWRLIKQSKKLLFAPEIVVEHLGYPDTLKKLIKTNFNYGFASTKLAKMHIGAQVDTRIYQMLLRNLLCAANPFCKDEWALLRTVQLSMFASGKICSSILYRTINL
jgi:GT2 family glycosyltransferase